MFKFNDHTRLRDSHSYLSASQHAWLHYTDDEFIDKYRAAKAAVLGSRIHALAAELISLKQRLPDTEETLNMHVNDAIDFGMSPEVVLYYSPNAFGTSDAIGYDQPRHFLRVHDLKTGSNPASMEQLYVYAAYFCLEYDMPVGKLDYNFRLYQNDTIIEDEHPDKDEIAHICDMIVRRDKLINDIQEEDSLWNR